MNDEKDKEVENDLGIVKYSINENLAIPMLVEITKKYESLLASLGSSTFVHLEKCIKHYSDYYDKHIKSYEETILSNLSVINKIAGVSNKQVNKILNSDYSEVFKKLGEFAIRYNMTRINENKEINDFQLKEHELTQDKQNMDATISTDVLSDEEFEEAFYEQLENPIGFQERIANWVEEKKKKYFVVVCFIWILLANFILPYFQQNIGIPVVANAISKVKDVPNGNGSVVCFLNQRVEAIITENVNYYYKVKFTDEEGIEREGYVAKKNLNLIIDEE